MARTFLMLIILKYLPLINKGIKYTQEVSMRGLDKKSIDVWRKITLVKNETHFELQSLGISYRLPLDRVTLLIVLKGL